VINFLKSEHMYHSLLQNVANSLLQLEAKMLKLHLRLGITFF
jgi:hypothetical protein